MCYNNQYLIYDLSLYFVFTVVSFSDRFDILLWVYDRSIISENYRNFSLFPFSQSIVSGESVASTVLTFVLWLIDWKTNYLSLIEQYCEQFKTLNSEAVNLIKNDFMKWIWNKITVTDIVLYIYLKEQKDLIHALPVVQNIKWKSYFIGNFNRFFFTFNIFIFLDCSSFT